MLSSQNARKGSEFNSQSLPLWCFDTLMLVFGMQLEIDFQTPPVLVPVLGVLHQLYCPHRESLVEGQGRGLLLNKQPQSTPLYLRLGCIGILNCAVWAPNVGSQNVSCSGIGWS